MKAKPPYPSTAAEEIALLCERLRADQSIRIFDTTGRRQRSITGTQLARLVDRQRDLLLAKGVEPNDTVLFAVRPSAAAVVNLLALMWIGARTGLVDFREPAGLISSRTRRLQPKWVLTQPVIALAARSPFRQLAHRLRVRIPPIHRLAPRVITTSGRRGRVHTPRPSPEPSDDALVVFTSGTTAEPKAVVHTQATTAAMFRAVVDLMGDVKGQVVLSDQFHSLIPSVAAGATALIAAPGIPAKTTAALITAKQVTTWFTTPAAALHTARLLTAPNQLRHVILGSAPVPKALVSQLYKHLPDVEVTAVYAMTEAVPVAITSGAAITAHAETGDLIGSVVAGLTVEIDASGELIIAGPRVGRYLDSAAPAPIRSGDIGHMTENGELVLDGRAKDMILVDARNIYPQHYEHALSGLTGVTAGALVGVGTEYGNEELWAVVELDTFKVPLQTIAAAVATDDYLAPLPLAGLVAGRLPYTGRSRKLDRTLLRAAVLAALASGSALRLKSR